MRWHSLALCLLIVLLPIQKSFGTSFYHREEHEHENELWDWDDEEPREPIESSSSESEEQEQGEEALTRHFKRHGQFAGPRENWPPDMYRTLSICVNETVNGTRVYRKEGEGTCPQGKAVAMGRYRNSVNESGWGILEVETFGGKYPPELQAYAAGIAEGALTKLQISHHYRNTVKGLCRNATEYCKKLYRYLNANLGWITSQVKSNQDLFWRQVNLTFTQLTGISDGYGADKEAYAPRLNFYITPVFMIQLSGELFDLNILFKKPAKNKMEKVELEERSGHCSGFVKVADGNKDLLMSHVAMSGYNTMNRMVKLYKFAYDPKEVPGYAVSFSGYPAALASADDFTLTSGGLLSVETTMAVFNETLYQRYVSPQGQLHCWLRSYIANQLASTAHDWVKLFSRFNSGTYNNQWTVVDYKVFKPGQELSNTDLIWILEQIPGTTISRDVTWFLRKYSYWPSYNIPYLRRVSELSGFDRKANENNWWRWGFCPRARIFHRDHHKVQDIDTLRALMRYNDYKHDEFSRCNCTPPYTAEASISTRGDLNPANGKYEVSGMGHRNHGGLDYKGTNYALFKQLRLEVVGGPTYGGPGDLPYFSWKTTDIKAPHFGQPQNWKFDPFVTQWVTPVSVAGMEDEQEE